MGRPTILRDGSGGQAEIIIRVHIHPGSHLLPTSLYPQGFLCLPSASFSANLSIVPHNFLFTGQRLTCRRESRLEFIIVFSSERGAHQVMVAPIAFIFIYAKTANEKIRGASPAGRYQHWSQYGSLDRDDVIQTQIQISAVDVRGKNYLSKKHAGARSS